MALELGNKKLFIIGNYRFTGRHLGKGNFARVEEAVHSILNVRVAIKIMTVNEIKEDYVVKNLYREARLMAKLNHPCIAALYQTIQRSDNVYYLVTEVASGGDLCSFIKNQRTGKLDERVTRIYARQFVSALSHMHNLGVVHRDLKMENVMLNSAQTQIKIVDFGLSNLYDPNEPLRTHCGSPEYAAPELFVTGRKYGPEVDLWSLGIILYGMVVGQLPFVSNRSEQISSQERRKKLVAQINKGLGSYHRKILSVCSAEFQSVLSKMLLADSSRRMTVRELLTHPWITEKGKKIIRSNPIRGLDTNVQSRIFLQMGELTGREFEEVALAVKNEPLGPLGGMYNIMAHKYWLSRINGDGITKNLSLNGLHLVKEKITKGLFNSRPSTSRTAPTKYDRGNNDENFDGRITLRGYCNAKRGSASHDPNTSRPKTVQTPVAMDYRAIKSPSLRRKVYSATITSKMNRPTTVPPALSRVCKSVDAALPKRLDSSAAERRKLIDVKFIKHGEVNRGQIEVEKPASKMAERVREVHPVTVVESCSSRRVSKETVMRTRAVESKSDSRSTDREAATRAVSRLSKQSDAAALAEQLEKSPFGFGDLSKQPATLPKSRKPIIYDPIARSIAGYVANNVPAKLPTFALIKKVT